MPIPAPRPSTRNAIPCSRPGLATRTLGLVLALVLGVAVVGAIVFFATRSGPGPAQGPSDADAPPDITELLNAEGETAQGMYIQLVDRDDPTKLEGEILADSFEPIDQSNRDVVRPRAWLFLEDGRTAYIEAAEGRFFIPPGQNQPEEGVLRGDVRVRLFPRQAGDRRADPASDTAELTATFSEPVRFDLRLGELSTRGRMLVESDELEFAGTDVRAVLNQARQRITLLEVERGEKLVYTPGTAEARIPEPAPTAPTAPTAHAFVRTQTDRATRPEPTETDAPAIDLYRAVFLDGVVAKQLDREIRADRLDVWVRLIDRKLPPRETAAAAAWTGTPLDIFIAAAIAQADEPSGTIDDTAPVTLTWSGQLRLNSLDDTAAPPEPLNSENLTLRFTSERTGLVEFADAGTNATGTAVALEYRDSAQKLFLSGTAGTVRLDSPDAGRIEGVSSLSVAMNTGLVSVRGPGILYAKDHEGDDPISDRRRAVRWTDAADFAFELEDGRMTDRLSQADFAGRVVAVGDQSELRGDTLAVEMEPVDPGADDPDLRLARLRLTRADARDGRGGTLKGDDMRVWFDTDAEDITPTRVLVTGAVDGRDAQGASIKSRTLDAALAIESGRTIVTEVEAEGDVVFGDGRDITAGADRLEARPRSETAVLTGDNAYVARATSVINGDRIELDGQARTVRVPGPGRLADEAMNPVDTGIAKRTLDLTWTDLMSFDDRAGRALASGRVEGELHTGQPDGALAVDRIDARRVVLELLPASEAGASTPEAADPLAGSTGDRVRTILAYGTEVGSSADDRFARLEARRYAPPAQGDTDEANRGELLRVLAVDGQLIRVLPNEDRLEVPGPGRLVSLDRDDDAEGAEGENADASGRLLVEWLGSMSVDRETSTADLARRVALVHVRPDDETTTELEAERLTIVFRERNASSAGLEGQLASLDASGAAWLRSGVRELLADRVLYDAERGIAFATAGAGNVVTLFEGERGTAMRAARLEWDLLRDRIRVESPSPTTAPR